MFSRLGLTLLVFLFLRLALMAFFPVMGDEAYYFYWGMHPAGGFYDLPPMIGWWVAPFAKVSLWPLWLRLPNLLSLGLIAASIYEWLSHGILKERAKWIAGLFALSPLPFLAFLMFPDVPLLFLGYFSAYLFFRACTAKSAQYSSFLFSGALLGAAFLSKYFALFLLPAYAIWFFSRKEKSFWGIVWFIVGALPFALQHILWNETHCWSNVIFNLVTRQNVNDGPLYSVLGFFVLYLGLASFPFWGRLRSNERLKLDLNQGFDRAEWVIALSDFTRVLWQVPIFIFAFTAFKGKGQGLHWLLFILPFFTIWVGLRLDLDSLKRAFRQVAYVNSALVLMVLIVSFAPEQTLGKLFQNRFQFEFAELNHSEELIEAILPDIVNANEVFTEGYTLSSVLNFDLQRYGHSHALVLPEVSVWGSGSRFGRVYDWTTNFEKLDGKKLVIVTPGPLSEGWSPYFSAFKREARMFHGRSVFVATGEGFKADLYLKQEYRKPIETYYGQSFLGAHCSLWDVTH